MAALELFTIEELLQPFDVNPSPRVLEQLSQYLDLLLKWNARTNLTSVRDAESIVCRHFGESLFLARKLPPCSTLLDLGSGAGFPGIPIQLYWPALTVTLAESQGKKASFLREVVRELNLGTSVYSERGESLVGERSFDVVALRAVDKPKEALRLAFELVAVGGKVCLIGKEAHPGAESYALPLGSVLSILTP